MAGPFLYTHSGAGNLSAILATLFQDDITNNIMRACVLPQVLPVKYADPGVQNISWVNSFSDTSYNGLGAVADGAAVTTYSSDVKVSATLYFTAYRDAVSVGGLAQAIAANTQNPAALGNLLGREILESSQRLAQKLSVDFYTGTGATNQLQGLYSTTGTTYGGLMGTGTYATISRSTYAEWAANVLANTPAGVARPLTIDLMREMRRVIYVASGLKPDLIVTDPYTHERYGQLLGQKRTMFQEVKLRGQMIALDGGYSVLDFDGVPVIEDVNHPEGKMSFLNTRTIEIQQVPFPTNPYEMNRMGELQLAGTPEEQFGTGNVKLSAKILNVNPAGDATNLEIVTYPQIWLRKPNACGHIADLETP